MSDPADTPPKKEPEDSYVGRVARGAGISSIGQGTGRVFGYVTQAVLARTFGAGQFGLYTLGIAVISAANILSQFGFDNGVVRYVAHYRTQEDAARVRGTIIQAVGITVGISLVVAVALFFGAGALTGWLNQPEAEPIVRAFAFALPLFALMSILAWATQGFQTVTYATYAQQILRPLVYFVLVVGVYFTGAGLGGVVVAYAVSMGVGAVFALYFLRKLFPLLFDRRVSPKFETRALVSVSLPMSVQRFTQYANNWTGVLVLGLFQSASAVGIFQAAFRTATLATLVRFAFNGIFSPIISNLYSRGEMEDLKRLYKDVTRWTFTGAFALFLVIVLLASEILLVFGGPEFTEGWTALVIVAAAQLFSTSVGPAPRMLAMTGNQNVVMVASATGAVLGVGACFLLVPEFGLVGAAIGVSAAISLENAATLVMVRRRLGVWPFSPQYLKPLSAGILAAGAAYLARTSLPLPDGLPSILAVGVVFGVCFLLLLALFGLSSTDREFLRAFWEVARRYLRRLRRGRSGGEEGQ